MIVFLSEHGACPRSEPSIINDPPFAELAEFGDEADVADELVVNNVVAAVEWPEEVRPSPVDLVRELVSSTGVPDVLLEARLEVLERGERLPAGVHLDIQVLVGLHVIQRQQVERNG